MKYVIIHKKWDINRILDNLAKKTIKNFMKITVINL